MKKVLLGTSAIALAGAFASQAAAAEWSMKVSGYLEEQVVFTDTDTFHNPGSRNGDADYNGVDVISDGEIHFSSSITLDNGIKFGARIELEGNADSDQVDETYAYVEGSFGRIVLGEDDNVANTMGYSAPDVSFYNINSGSDTLSLPFSAAFGTTSTFVTAGEADSAGIRYFTPRMAGFQLGVSYARDANKSNDDNNKDENEDGKLVNIWAVGANYVNTIGDVSIAASGGYTKGSRNGTADKPYAAVAWDTGFFVDDGGNNEVSSYYCANDPDAGKSLPGGPDVFVLKECVTAADSGVTPGKPNTDPEAYAFGLNVGFGGFTVGGSYAKYDETSGSDRSVYDLGASYETGPWGFSFTYLHSKMDESDGHLAKGSKIDKFLVAADYDLAAGVRLGAFAAYEELDANTEGVKDIDGFVIGTGMKLSF